MAYVCDVCTKSYKHERNLKRHMREKHSTIQYWFCDVQSTCVSKFIRRSYLAKHLMLKHGFHKLEANYVACKAPRGDIQRDAYYEDVSEDDSILDLIEEMDQKQYEQQYVDSISNFEILDINNNDIGTSSVNISNKEMSSDMADSSFNVITCDQYSDISSCGNSDQKLDNDKISIELDYEEVDDSDSCPKLAEYDFVDAAVTKGDVSDAGETGNVDGADEIGDVDDADGLNEADDISDTEAIGNQSVAHEFGDRDEAVEYGDGDVADEFGDGDEADEFDDGDEAMANDDGNNVQANSDSENDIIVIDSDDEYALVQSNMQRHIQTFVYKITKDTTYIEGRLVDIKTYVERDYYEKWY